MIRVALAGAGFMGTVHAERWASLPGVRVVGVFSRSPEHARALAERVGAEACTEVDALLDLPADVVDVAVPTHRHAAIALRAFTAGRHVVCEKPLALSLEEAEQMTRAATAAGKLLLVAHVLRFWPEYAELRRLVRSGAIGQPTSALAQRLQEGPTETADAAARRAINGGPVVDLQIHDDDLLLSLFGPALRVTVVGSERHVFTTLRFTGAVALAEAASDLPAGFPFTSLLRVVGDGGMLQYMFQSGGRRPDEGSAGGSGLVLWRPGHGPEAVPVEPRDPYTEEITHFAECVRMGQPSALVSPAQAVDALRIALAARQALDSGQPVAP